MHFSAYAGLWSRRRSLLSLVHPAHAIPLFLQHGEQTFFSIQVQRADRHENAAFDERKEKPVRHQRRAAFD